MIIDLRSLPGQNNFNCDLCIIGGGAAGIAMALEFLGTGVEVLLLESGGFELEDETQELYRGEDIGLPYFDLEYARLRYFGGTTNHWGGMSAPLSPIDFQERAWVAHSGWPITYETFKSYLPRASKAIEIPNSNYDALYWLDHTSKKTGHNAEEYRQNLLQFDQYFKLGMFQFSPPTQFGKTYRSTLENAHNIKVLLNANVTSIDTLSNPHVVDRVSVATLDGKQSNIHPKQVVLATGGVENARLLLASNQTHTRGLGNDQDLVGRFFADHIELESGYILSSKTSEFLKLFAEHRDTARFSLEVLPEIQRSKKMLNIGLTLTKVPNRSRSVDGVAAARRIKHSIDNGKWPNNFFSDVGTAIMDIDDVISYIGSKNTEGDGDFFMITNRVEPQPNPNSRITLSDQKDALNIPEVKLNWQLSEVDYYSIYEMHKMLGKLLGASGHGRINIELEEEFGEWPGVTQGGNHHMGTTRMSDTPSKGVVDKNCKVFNIANLYVAGSSIFPTFGKANPTMNLVALTIRLADHLKKAMG